MEGFSPVFNELRFIEFTDAGKADLSGFSDAVIRYADENMAGKMGLERPFAYFLGICKKETAARCEIIDYSRVSELAHAYGIDLSEFPEKVVRFNPAGLPGRVSKSESNQEKRALSEAKYKEWSGPKLAEARKERWLRYGTPLKGDLAARYVARQRMLFELGLWTAEDLKEFMHRQRDDFGEVTEGLGELYEEIKDKPVAESNNKFELLQRMLFATKV